MHLLMQVAVETLEKGFLVNIHSDRTCPGLLVPILGAFEELGLIVSEARVSCIDSFRLEALGGEVRMQNFILTISSSMSHCSECIY